MRLTICWTTRGRQRRFYYDICKKFGISDYMSVNHETPCDIRDEDMELLKECEKTRVYPNKKQTVNNHGHRD